MRIKRRRNLGALVIACIADWIFMSLLLIWFWSELYLITKIFIFSEVAYSMIILTGAIITTIQDKQINKEFRKLCEENERLYNSSK